MQEVTKTLQIEIKGGIEMVELKGSEKQVKWANDLREKMNKECEMWAQAIKETEFKSEETREKAANQIESVKNYVNSIENAGDIIKEFKEFWDGLYRNDKMRDLVKKINNTSSIGRAGARFLELI